MDTKNTPILPNLSTYFEVLVFISRNNLFSSNVILLMFAPKNCITSWIGNHELKGIKITLKRLPLPIEGYKNIYNSANML